MFKCQEMFGKERGEQICSMVEASISSACPCKAGRPCPLLSGTLAILTLPTADPMMPTATRPFPAIKSRDVLLASTPAAALS